MVRVPIPGRSCRCGLMRALKQSFQGNCTMPTASGFDFEPLPDGSVRIEFIDDDGRTVNTQIVTADVVRRMPLVATLLDVAMRLGPDVAREIVERLNTPALERKGKSDEP